VNKGGALHSCVAWLADIGPLRRHRNFRRLWFGLLISTIGSQLTLVGVAFQAYSLTHSTLVVGLVSLVQLGPTLIGSLGGGAVADAHDRRRVLVLAQLTLALGSAGLAANAFLPHPHLWVLFVATCASAAFQGLDWPTRSAIMPMIVPVEDLPSAYALQSVVINSAVVIGPALAGVIIAAFGLGAVYTVDVASFGATLVAALLLPSLVPAGGGTPISLGSVREGFRFLRSERLLSATFWLDLNAMTFGMPKAVFPALGVGLFAGGAGTVGLLFAAPGAGAVLGTLFSGWVGKVRSQGRALVVCMLLWGGAIAGFGVVPVLWVGLGLLGLAGAADVIGGVFRLAILQRRTPAALQGRLSGVFYAAAVSGNRLGDGESGAAAALGGAQFAVWSGGLACIVGTLLMAWRVPSLWQKGPVVAKAGDPA
jgi:predicted MFS family arabinose efflux permease